MDVLDILFYLRQGGGAIIRELGHPPTSFCLYLIGPVAVPLKKGGDIKRKAISRDTHFSSSSVWGRGLCGLM